MDGSAAGYYLSPAPLDSASSRNSWIIELQGGGECASFEQCHAKLNTALGSSDYFAADHEFGYLLSDDARANPRLRTWNRVHIPYCSQDLWTGRRRAASAVTFSVFFAGRHILEAVLDHLDRTAGLATADEVILTGESAGGIGVWPNLDWLAERYPRARVTGAPIAGFYFSASPYTGPRHTESGLVDFREEAWPSHVALWNSTADASCEAAGRAPWQCILANETYPYIESRVFVTQSQTDKVVLLYHDWVPDQDPQHSWSAEVLAYVREWSGNMSVALDPVVATGTENGVFAAACFIHTNFSADSPLVRGRNFLGAFYDF